MCHVKRGTLWSGDKSKTRNPDMAKTYIERAIFPFLGGGPKNFLNKTAAVS